MATRTTRRAFEKRMRGVRAGLLTLLAVGIQMGALLATTALLPPQISAWRSKRATDEAQELTAKGKMLEAMSMLNFALALDPKNEQAHYDRGILELVVNSDPAAASKDFATAIEINDRFGRAYYNLGVVQLFYEHKPRLAVDNLKRACELEPTDAPCFAVLGLAHEAVGEYGSARDAFDRYIALDPAGRWAELVKQHRHAIGGLPAVDDLGSRMRDAEDVFEVVAVGDLSLARGVNVDLYSGRSESPLRFVAPLISRSAVAFGNLESPLTKRTFPEADKGPAGGDIHLKGNPDYAFLLTEAGFDVVSLANNHIMDYGDGGLRDTMHYLDQQEIKYCGAGVDPGAAFAPAEVDLDGYKIHFLAFNGVAPADYNAAAGKAGTAPLTEDAVVSGIAASSGKANLVVVSLHWGEENMAYPSSEQVRMAHRFVDAGADVIVGHHPHVLQGVESYNNGIIAYSLGNFLFDSRFPRRHYSTALTVEVSRSKGILGFRLVPIYIEGTVPTVPADRSMDEFMDFVLLSGSGKRPAPPKPAKKGAS